MAKQKIKKISYLRKQVTPDNAVAICHNIKHYGYLSDHMVKKHECCRKQCPLLEKIPDRAFWYAHDIKKCLRKIKKTGSGKIAINGKKFMPESIDITNLSKFCKNEYKKTGEEPTIEITD